MAKLIDYLLDFLMFSFENGITDCFFESEYPILVPSPLYCREESDILQCALFPLIVELVVQQPLDGVIHSSSGYTQFVQSPWNKRTITNSGRMLGNVHCWRYAVLVWRQIVGRVSQIRNGSPLAGFWGLCTVKKPVRGFLSLEHIR